MLYLKYFKKSLVLLPFVMVFFVLSCEKKEKMPPASVQEDLRTKNFVIPAENADAEANANVAKNPAHGEPGHRCDIPVGAPLNSPPNPSTAPQVPIQNQPSTTAPTGSGKINPPHGQPGHDCAVPVGAPL